MANGRANGQIKIMDGGHWSTKSDFISIQMFNSNLVLQIKRKKKKKLDLEKRSIGEAAQDLSTAN